VGLFIFVWSLGGGALYNPAWFGVVKCLEPEVRMSRLLIALGLVFGMSLSAVAGTKNPFRVEATDTKLTTKEEGSFTVTLRVPKEHHLYRDMLMVTPTTLKFTPDGDKGEASLIGPELGGHLAVGAPSFPPGFFKADPADPTSSREQYDMDVVIEIPVTAASATGTYILELQVEYQGCKKSLCWMPQTDLVESTVSVSESKK
jgi:hypothetical protein